MRRPPHSLIPNYVDIDNRPAIEDKQSRFGDLEGDRAVSMGIKDGIATFFKRTGRFWLAGHIADKKAILYALFADGLRVALAA
jgi:IS30 family transposase